MFKFLIRGLQAGLVVTLLADYRRASVDLLRIEAATACVRGLQVARLSALGLLGMGLLVGLLLLGVLLLHAGLFVLLPWPVKVKALVGMLLGGGYMVAGGVALRMAFNEKVWMDKTGVTAWMDKATRQLPSSRT